MKKIVLLTLALTLSAIAARAGGTDYPYCSCDLCALDPDATCEAYDVWGPGLRWPCVTYSALHCPA